MSSNPFSNEVPCFKSNEGEQLKEVITEFDKAITKVDIPQNCNVKYKPRPPINQLKQVIFHPTTGRYQLVFKNVS